MWNGNSPHLNKDLFQFFSMRTKNMETDEIRKDASVYRSQFGLPQICLENPKMVIELDERTITGIISMYEEYKREQSNLPLIES